MTIIFIGLGCALVGVLAAATWWRWTSPGKRLCVGSFTLYYPPAVTAGDAERVVQYLTRQNFTYQDMDARLTRQGAIYKLQLICSGQPAESQLMTCEVLAAGLSDDVFAGAAVEIQVCDAIFRPISTVPHRGRFGHRISMNGAHLFFLEGVADSEAFNVAAFLAGVGVFDDSPKISQMNRGADGYEFRLAVEVDPLTPEMIEGERQMASDLSRVVRGAPVAVHFCKGLLKTLRAAAPLTAESGAAARHVPVGPFRTEVFTVPKPSSAGSKPYIIPPSSPYVPQ